MQRSRRFTWSEWPRSAASRAGLRASVSCCLFALVFAARAGAEPEQEPPEAATEPSAESSQEPENEPSGESEAPTELDVVVRAEARRKRRAFSSTRSTTIVDRHAITEQAPKSVADALRQTPSVSVQQTTPGQGTIIVRGLSGRALYHGVDGVRLNSAIFRAGNNPYLGLVDPYALEAVEVVPGASSVRYGSEALAGAVLFHTRLPGYRLGAPLTTFRTHQSLTSNPLGNASRFSVDHSQSRFALSAGFSYLAAGPVTPGENVKSPDPASFRGLEKAPGTEYAPVLLDTQRGTEFSFVAANVSARRKLGSGSELVGRAQFGLRPELVRYDLVVPRFKSDAPGRAESVLQPMYRGMASLGWIGSSSRSAFDRTAVFVSWQRLSERELRRGFDELCLVGGTPVDVEPEACAGRLRLEPSREASRETNRSDALTLRGELDSVAGEGESTLHLGAELSYDRVTSFTVLEDTATGSERPGEARFPDGSFMLEAGTFAELSVRPFRPLSLTAGGRASLFSLDVTERSGATPAPGFEKTLFDGAASLGARFELAPWAAWFANVGRGVRSPNVQDFATLGARARGRYQLPNPDIGSEHTTTVDGGVKLERGRLRAQTALFLTHYTDPIVLAPTVVNGNATSPEGDAYYWSKNAGSVELFGLDAAFELPLSARASLLGRWVSMLGTQRNPPELGLPEETPADRVPPHQGELGLKLTPATALELEALVAGRLAQRRLNDPTNLEDNRIPEGGTPGYATFHARASYAASHDAIVRVSFDNITDRLVLEHGSGFYRPGFSTTVSLDLVLD